MRDALVARASRRSGARRPPSGAVDAVASDAADAPDRSKGKGLSCGQRSSWASRPLGHALLSGLPGMWQSVILAVAAGGIRAMLADTMVPEAFRDGKPWVALAATAGFSAAFLLVELAP